MPTPEIIWLSWLTNYGWRRFTCRCAGCIGGLELLVRIAKTNPHFVWRYLNDKVERTRKIRGN